MESGLIFTTFAVLSWGIGDFLIQKSIKSTNKIITLFIIQALGFLMLTPFAIGKFIDISRTVDFKFAFILILFVSVVTFAAAMLDFQALLVGKISVIVPIISMEILVTAAFSNIFLNETISTTQLLFSIFLIIGIILISIEDFSHFKDFKLEKGIGFAILATIGMGAVNFLFGYSSRIIDPILVNWGVDFFLSIFAFVVMIFSLDKSLRSIKAHPMMLVSVAAVDNIAWITFAIAMTLLPIAIVTGISESYIVISALLGVFINKENLRHFQYLGLLVIVGSAILLGSTV